MAITEFKLNSAAKGIADTLGLSNLSFKEILNDSK
jgi:hypothetical protein